MTTNLTRRTALTAALATAAAPAALAATPTRGDDAELLELGRQLEALWPEYIAADDAEDAADRLAYARMAEWCKSIGMSERRLCKRQPKVWKEATFRIDRECGGPQAFDRLEDLRRRIHPLFDRVMAMRPTTMQGLAVQAKTVGVYMQRHLWSVPADRIDHLDWPDQGLRRLMDSIYAAGGVSLAELTDRVTEA